MKLSYKKILTIFAIVVLTAVALNAYTRLINAYETRDWVTYTDDTFGFSLKHPKEIRIDTYTQPYKDDPSKTYYSITFNSLSGENDDGYIQLRVVENQDDVDDQYADRETVNIRGKSWRYYNSGALTDTRRVNFEGEIDSEGEVEKEYTWYWEEYITRLDPEWKIEVYTRYEGANYDKIVDTLVRSIIFK